MVLYLSYLNLAVWVVVTFEIQSVASSEAEIEVFGLVPWIIIQRVTMPLAIFFRKGGFRQIISLSKNGPQFSMCENLRRKMSTSLQYLLLPSSGADMAYSCAAYENLLFMCGI